MRMILALMVAATGINAQAQAASPLPVPPKLEFLFEEQVMLAGNEPIGETVAGGRIFVGITGGTFKGAGISGKILPGGWDWQQQRSDGCLRIRADYFWRTDDGVRIKVLNQGIACPPVNGVAPPVYTWPEFEVQHGKYEWLTRTPLVGVVEHVNGSEGPAVHIRFYRIIPDQPD